MLTHTRIPIVVVFLVSFSLSFFFIFFSVFRTYSEDQEKAWAQWHWKEIKRNQFKRTVAPTGGKKENENRVQRREAEGSGVFHLK